MYAGINATQQVYLQQVVKVIEYNHHALQGNIEIKKSIILLLADQLESKRETLRSINKTLENNIFFLTV